MTDRDEALVLQAREEFGQLGPFEEILCRAAINGESAEYQAGPEVSYAPANADQWTNERNLRAGLVRWLCRTSKLWNSSGNGSIEILGGQISGELRLDHFTLDIPLLFSHCDFTAPICLRNAKLRTLDLTGKRVVSIVADEVQVEGSVYLRDGFQANGPVRFYASRIKGNLDCQGGLFFNHGTDALVASSSSLGGDLLLCRGFSAEGRVTLSLATVRGNLDCSAGRFRNEGGTALSATNAKIAGDVRLSANSKVEGNVELFGASVGGRFLCSGEVNGTLDLRNAVLGGDLNCKGGHFVNSGKDALIVARARIGGTVFLSSDFKAQGKVSIDNARVSGDFRCSTGEFINKEREALTAKGAQIAGNVFLNNGFQPYGNVVLRRLKVDGRLTIDAIGDPSNTDDLDLRFAQVAAFNHHWQDWPKPGHLLLNGFTYSALGERFLDDSEGMEGPPLNAQVRRLANGQLRLMPDIDWLRRQSTKPFWLQPYEQLAKVLRSNGDETAAKRVLIAKYEDLRCYGNLKSWAKGWNWFLGRTIGYGYEPHRALAGMVLFVLLGWAIFGWASDHKLMTRTGESVAWKGEPEPDYPKFNKFIYSLDTFLPIVDLKEKSYWLPNANKTLTGSTFPYGEAVRIYLWIHILLGWILTTLWVAGFSGLVRKGS